MTGDSPRLSRVARNAVFAPLDQLSRPELVARRLSDSIALGVLPDADQLPAESELAERFGVSTVTVRQALGILREQGLVQTRRGRNGGSFVCAPQDPAQNVLEARLRSMSAVELRDLCDHYTAINGAAAALAATRADNDDVERIQAATKVEIAGADPRSHRRAEGQFHIEVAAATQSPRLTREEIALQREIAPLLWLPTRSRQALRDAARHHERVASAIADEDPAAARAGAEEHIRDAFTWVRQLQIRLQKSRQR
jgi:GntR family transcriptional regulator, transcriptional repressor for pyruvate dehydrogenase complex